MDTQKTKETLQSSTPPPHQDDADEEDENVKQLKECSSLYLSLQECLVQKDRNWKACQKGMMLYSHLSFY
ncbi:hypothetical protein IFM89_000929 [Coptis chinensis]|uniref:Uncharacterized protein n=1 Tax=Coptis chinensis TaxID=261450 RepID=A0A835M936_9MAGN|nr:hypothetical protein IFM89_000929 [Coptis chinensis]